MPASPIVKKLDVIPSNWVHLQKTMIPDQETGCYWSVWYDPPTNMKNGTAWLMWCPFGDDPSVNDSWAHAEDLDGDCKNALTAIEAIYGVSFHDSIWFPMTSTEVPSLDEIRKSCGEK